MDEYERLEEDLQRLYEDYMMKFRNMTYLEQTYEEYNRVEQDKFEVKYSEKFLVGEQAITCISNALKYRRYTLDGRTYVCFQRSKE